MALHAWRAGASSVHLDVDTTLPGPSGDVKLTVFGGVAFDPDVFADLEPGQTVPVSLGQLTEWAGALGVAA
ncbi:MAG TPA: hypothetical protein VFX16_21760 [Pseudonocardiaceae bacterium]|nr:hypothetical protein [Pseudonocardiaceae bacterium]